MQINKNIKVTLSKIGSLILKYDWIRQLANSAYINLDYKFVKLFVKLFDQSIISKDFLWKDRFLDKEFVLPVSSIDSRTSWQVALSSRWAEPQIRKLSEIYIQNHRGTKTFIDIGSNHGLRSYPFLLHNYHCILFEPQAKCNQFVQNVASINQFHDLVIEQCVLSSKNEAMDFFISNSTYLSSLSKLNAEKDGAIEKGLVMSKRMDDYCIEHNLHPSLIKIDVEGHEWDVIKGGQNIISTIKPTLIIEIWNNERDKESIYDFLVNLDYRVFSISETQVSHIKNIKEFMQCSESDFIFCTDEFILPAIYELCKIS